MASKKISAQETLSKIVDQLNKSLDAAEASLGTEAPSLTADAKRRIARTRKGGERVLQMISELVKAHNLDSTSLSSTQMMAQLDRSTTFASSLARLQKLEKRVSDEQFVAQGDAWSMGLQFYALLQRRAVSDGTLATSLAPITSFFNYRHDSTKPTKLQTRANAKLRDAQKLVARAKPRASVIEADYDAHLVAPTTPASAPAPVPVATPTTAPLAHVATPAPVVAAPPPATPSVIVPAPSNGAVNGSNGSIGYVNGSNGSLNGASNGAPGV
jgi:hypothetical protein